MDKIDRLYIHVPFCMSKCSYCAFHSVTISNSVVDNYFVKLEKDIKELRHLTGNLKSIFIGGGTPSLLSLQNIEKLFSIINNSFKIKETAEISIENNPETLTDEKIRLISSFANRMSIGVQSFNDKHRSIIGRSGSIKNINSIIEKLINNNINNISIDLIYGIPTQTLNDWEQELINALKLPIKHISAYALTYEEGTKLSSQNKQQKSDTDEISAEMWQLTSDILHQSNISRYEVSNYSRTGYECQHNLATWYGSRYLGFGPAASSFDGKSRWSQPKLNQWLKSHESEFDHLDVFNRTLEIFIMGLRTSRGWIIKDNKIRSRKLLISTFAHEFYFTNNEWGEIFNKLINLAEMNLLNIKKTNGKKILISPTDRGLLFWDEIALELLE